MRISPGQPRRTPRRFLTHADGASPNRPDVSDLRTRGGCRRSAAKTSRRTRSCPPGGAGVSRVVRVTRMSSPRPRSGRRPPPGCSDLAGVAMISPSAAGIRVIIGPWRSAGERSRAALRARRLRDRRRCSIAAGHDPPLAAMSPSASRAAPTARRGRSCRAPGPRRRSGDRRTAAAPSAQRRRGRCPARRSRACPRCFLPWKRSMAA